MRLGRYELLHRLAKGGMGEVFLARRKGPGDIEKRVVIKRIRSELSGDPRFVEMFLREARVSMGLSHRNIAAVFDFGRAGPELFLAMEHVDGRDLARANRAGRKAGSSLSDAACAYLALQVCRGLEYAHGNASGDEAIVHRDLSPKNILLSFSGEVVVADFGLAIDSNEQLDDGAVRGTPAYLSPEQARGDTVDARSDLFSLGLVLYELVVGRPAYEGDSPEALIALAREGRVAPLDEGASYLASVIAKATARAPKDRYESARAMAAALDDVLVSARTAGARPPDREISEWLHGLFDSESRSADPVGHDEVAAVTYLDDGDNIVRREIRDLGDATMASIAATIGDSSTEAKTASSTESQAASRPRWRRALVPILIALTAIIGASIVVSTIRGGENKDNREQADASPTTRLVLDAGLDVKLDAAIVDAQPVVFDAAPDAAAKARVDAGFVRVHSRPWATVAVRGSKGCAETPCRIKLPAGSHVLRLKNPVTKATASKRVTVKPGETIDVSLTLKAPSD